MFVSSEYSFKNFPILIEVGDEIILCPETMFIIQGFLIYDFNEEQVNNILNGKEFKEYIGEELEKLGFSTKDPKNPRSSLKGRKIKENKKIKYEIDLIAYDNSTIWVIECKDQGLWKIKPKILWKRGQENRVKTIKEEIKKHKDRVQYVKENYKSYFGFKKDYQIKGLIVTRIKENLENEDNEIQILLGYELKNIKDK